MATKVELTLYDRFRRSLHTFNFKLDHEYCEATVNSVMDAVQDLTITLTSVRSTLTYHKCTVSPLENEVEIPYDYDEMNALRLIQSFLDSHLEPE